MFKKQKKSESTNPQQRRVIRSSENLRYNPYQSERRPANVNSPASSNNQVRRRPDESGRGAAQEERGTKLKKLVVRRRIIIIAAAGVIMLTVCGLLYVNTTPKIEIANEGDSKTILLHPKEQYQAAASTAARKSLANYNKITFDASMVEKTLAAEFPELSKVRVKMPVFGTQPIVVITPSKPTAFLQSAGGTYVIDSNGLAISDATAMTGLSLPSIVDQTNAPVVLGKQMLPSSTLSLVNQLQYQLDKKGIAIESFILPASSAHEVDMRVVGSPYYVKFSTAKPDTYSQQIGSYIALRDYLAGKGITPGEYADVRLPGRAYYK